MHNLGWYIQDKVILIELMGAIDMEELLHINGRVVTEYFDPAHEQVHLIAHGKGVTKFPMNLAGAVEATNKISHHPQHGISIYVSIFNREQSFLGKVVPVVQNVTFFTVDTMEEADKILKDLNIN